MTGVRVKVAPFFSGGQKKFLNMHYRSENFFALMRAPGMTHNADDISPLWETGRGGLGKREWYLYKNRRKAQSESEKRKHNALHQGNSHN
jgi:hypothetical protein